MEKLKGGIFDGPQIRQLMKDTDFIKVMTVPESDAWKSFVLVVENFLGNHKAPNYEEIVQNMLTNFQTLGANMSIKLHYLRNHLDKFPDNLGNYSEEQDRTGSESDGRKLLSASEAAASFDRRRKATSRPRVCDERAYLFTSSPE
ncbi:hypothetical protein EVAR_24545_1 [Eumeta japonica]|uniref:Uncharacterized protein n=1 Tax=Eumeta variegata TaxID=151549 RepID=A0A4C1URC6_EUMVA|nr:hypothetical protein EVAR_24545_1 [Eumeta japonica]